MKVVYYLDQPTSEYIALARMSVESVCTFMPDAEIVLLTTMQCADMNIGADVVIPMDLPTEAFYVYRRVIAQGRMTGNCLFMDVDCIVKRDLRHVFARDFDIAISYRNEKTDGHVLPFNGGAVFSTCPAFWGELASHPEAYVNWFTAENFFGQLASKDRYSVRLLNGAIYNYIPTSKDDDPEGKAIIHYKGDRKSWALERATCSQ